MPTHVTQTTVRDRQGNLRHLQVVRSTHPDPRRGLPATEEFLLDGNPVEAAGEGRFRVTATGEILRALPADR